MTVGDVYELWSASLRLHSSPFQLVESSQGFRASLVIFVTAALSRGLSDAGIMMINRVSRLQFVRGLLGGALALAVAAVVWAGCIWAACVWPLGLWLPYRDVLGLVLLSYAPLVFGVFTIVPHLGLFWDALLKVWMLLITVTALHLRYGVPWLHAVAASGVGWLLFHLLGELFGSRVEKLRLRLLGRHGWVRPKEAVLALLERQTARQ